MKQLKNDETAIERRIGGAAAPEQSGAGDAEFEALVTELAELIEQDKLPEGFDLNKAAGDAALGWCDDQAEFEFTLDLLLDGLSRHHRVGADLGQHPPQA